VEKQAVPAAAAPSDTPLHGHWAIVGAAYRKQDAAEKRARSIRKAHPRLNAEVYPAFPGARRYLIVLGSAPTQADARKQAHRLRTEGAPRNAYVTRLE
jgi:hypothetical protein